MYVFKQIEKLEHKMHKLNMKNKYQDKNDVKS